MGRSFRTGNINSNEINDSKIFEHFEQKDHPIRVEDFKILTSCPNEDLFILESIYIHKLNPTLNERNSSFNLCILKWFGRYWCMYFWIGITIIIISTLTNFLLIFKILFNFFLKLYPGYGFVYLCFSKYYVCFYAWRWFWNKIES